MALNSWCAGFLGRTRIFATDLRNARATLAFLVILGSLGVGLELLGGVVRLPEVYLMLGLSHEGLGQGRAWQLVSHAFIHGNMFHLVVNLVSLTFLGPRLERIGGTRLMSGVFFSGVVAGGIAHLLLVPAAPLAVPLVGASGGIVAMLLFLTGVSPQSRMWPLPVSGRSLGLGILLASLVLALMVPALGFPYLSTMGAAADRMFGGQLFQASHACHAGGAVAGWAWSRWMLRPRVTLETLRKRRARNEGVITAVDRSDAAIPETQRRKSRRLPPR